MTVREDAFLFDCQGDALVGVIAAPSVAAQATGVLVVVGGPQYRVGSHRQFVHLGRALAEAGVPCMRFDCRGMGDAGGAPRSFESIDADIDAALDAFLARAPGLSRVVLWGLCDGASAAAFYAPRDRRVAGLVLLNPWVRTAAGEAETYLRHYYLRRLFSPAFWRKLAGGGVSLGRSLRELGERVRLAGGRSHGGMGGPAGRADQPLPARFREALETAALPWLVVLSGRDYVAREFEQVLDSAAWSSLRQTGQLIHLPEADHTFSTAAARDALAAATLDWLRGLPARAGAVPLSAADGR